MSLTLNRTFHSGQATKQALTINNINYQYNIMKPNTCTVFLFQETK